jgi:hypothetical protein
MTVSTATTPGQILTSAYVNNNINSGLVYIAEASGTAVSSLSFNNCFSSTYLNYRIIGNVTVSEITNNLGLRYRLAGSDNSTSNYTWVANNLSSSAGTPSTATVGGQAQTIGYVAKKSSTADHRTGFVIDIFNPFSATGHKSLTFQSNNVSVPLDMWQGGIALATTGAFDGFSLISQSGSMSISAKVYGYRQA